MFSLRSTIRKTGELAKRCVELERQMRALDLQVDEFQRQVSAVAGQEATLSARIANLGAGGRGRADGVPAESGSFAGSRRFVLADPETGVRTALQNALGRKGAC